jgi:hypothetical protein
MKTFQKHAKTVKAIIDFIDDKEQVSFEEIQLHLAPMDKGWHLTLNDLLFAGEIRRVGGLNGKYMLPA